MVDYLVVGLGLAGTSFCETLRRNRKSFHVITDRSQTSSRVAGGLLNPVILKRFTLSWKADEQLPLAIRFYEEIGEFLKVKILEKRSVLRKFVSVEEQNLWFEATDKLALSPFLDSKLVPNTNDKVKASLGFGKVLETAVLDTQKLLQGYEKWLTSQNKLLLETFDYDAIQFHSEFIDYKGFKAKHIVFAEGFGLAKNPFFNYLPMQGSKGEYLTIRVSDLNEEHILKSSVFLIPLGDDLYKAGATYSRGEKNNFPTATGKTELLDKLKKLLNGTFEIVDQEAGVRPTVKDRRPLVGKHPKKDRVWLLNGFGSHGIMIGPWASLALYHKIEHDLSILPEMDIARFEGV